ncbi:MAG: CheR family methyltransferase [Pseudomonadota bacterium]
MSAAAKPAAGGGTPSDLIPLREHAAFAELVRRHAGIKLGENKRQLLTTRLQKRMRSLGLTSFAAYRQYLEANMADEIGELINAITTNLTAFFRENHHFLYLRRYFDEVPPGARLRVWSAGCSTGEEPYSIAMVYLESSAPDRRVTLEITATDIDSNCLRQADSGIYDRTAARGLSEPRLVRHFLRGVGRNAGRIRVRPEPRALVRFHRHNLMNRWNVDEPFDLVFCRNVVIYFDDDVQKAVFRSFAEALAPEGLIFIGHSENLLRVSEHFQSLGQTIYRSRA